MTKKNTRSLDAIANDIQALERKSVFEIGDLLLEGKAQCEHGQWLAWLGDEFDWSVDTAERYAKVAELCSRFRRLRNLKLCKITLYELARHDEEDLPAIIAELAKHATKTRLAPRDARRVILVGMGRRRFGDHPDATLYRVMQLEILSAPWCPKAVAGLKDLQPTTDEAANAIVDDIRREYEAKAKTKAEAETEAKTKAEAEAEVILDGKPPALPPPAAAQDQRLPCGTADVNVTDFVDAVRSLCRLSTRTTAAKLASAISLRELGTARDLIAAVLTAAGEKKAA